MLLLVAALFAPAPTAAAAFDGLSSALSVGEVRAARGRPCADFVRRFARLKRPLGKTHLWAQGPRAAAPVRMLGRDRQLLFTETPRGWRLDRILEAPPGAGTADARAAATRAAWVEGGEPIRTWRPLALPGRGVKFARRMSQRAVATADGQTWLLLRAVGGDWPEVDRTKRRSYLRAWLAGKVEAPFELEKLPTNAAAEKLLRKLAEAVRGHRIAEVRALVGRPAELAPVASKAVAVDATRLFWLAGTRRGVAPLLVSYQEGGQRYTLRVWVRIVLTEGGPRVEGATTKDSTDWLLGQG